MRVSKKYTITDSAHFKKQLLQWAQTFKEVVFLDSNDYPQTHTSFEAVLAVDALTALQTDYDNAFKELHDYQQVTKDWLFGYLTYDLKNNIEDLISQNSDGLQFPELFFFQPKKLFFISAHEVELSYLPLCDDEIDEDFHTVLNTQWFEVESILDEIRIEAKVSKTDYKAKVANMLSHIHRGDIYEANFCMEFFASPVKIDPLSVFQKLDALSEPPFAVFLKNHQHYVLSASPERYLRKEGTKILSQPIKGTAKRFEEPTLDFQSKKDLATSTKERSENIMIVDLVRNDLSHTAIKGTVKVTELCEIYTFKQVHQMISTVTSEVDANTSPVAVLQTTFPMGSMTGAPKISAMKIIEDLEESKRGVYSGAVGYFAPNGDFDFNVVIRSILYNQKNQYVSFSVGSAITALSDPEKEYEECMLKAAAMHKVLEKI